MNPATDPANAPLWLSLFGAVFVLIGLVFVPMAWRRVREDRASQQWPQAVATLVSVEVVKHVQERDAEEHHRRLVSHACVLHYRYRVAGIEHGASEGLPARDPAHAQQLADAQLIGSARSLWHDPIDPARHRLRRPHPLGGLVWLLPALGFAGFGALVLWLARSY